MARITSGVTGVRWEPRHKRWVAEITVNGKRMYFGEHRELEDAIATRKAAEKEHVVEISLAEHARVQNGTKHKTEKDRRKAGVEASMRVQRRRQKECPRTVKLERLRMSAQKRGIEFAIDETDIILKEFCECCGKRMILFPKGGDCPKDAHSTDRLESEKGYIRGNLDFICHGCNTKKSNCDDPDRLQKVVNYMRRKRRAA